jgi:hypothetical protein
MKAHGGVDLWIHVFLTSALIGGEWSALSTGCFTTGDRAPGTNWVGPRSGLDDVEKRTFLTLPGLELQPLCRLARSQSLYRLSYPGSIFSCFDSYRGSNYCTACRIRSESLPRNIPGSLLAVFSFPRFLCSSVLTRHVPLRPSLYRQDGVDEIAFCRQFSYFTPQHNLLLLDVTLTSSSSNRFLPSSSSHPRDHKPLALRFCAHLSSNDFNFEES